MLKRKAQLYEIEQSLPQMNSVYLKVSDINTNPNTFAYLLLSLTLDYSWQCERLDSQSSGKSSLQR